MDMTDWFPTDRQQRIDLPLYERELRDFLPDRVYDIHTHIGLPEHMGPISAERIAESWALEVSPPLPIEGLAEAQAGLFPGKRVRSLAFAMPVRECNLPDGNAYVAKGIADNRIDGLLVSDPTWSAEVLANYLDDGGYLGLKPYPDLCRDKPAGEVGIPDYFPEAHQKLADERGLIVMLHIPRKERLRDPRNQQELREIANRYSNIKLIVAHIGRAYTMSYVENALPALDDCPSLVYDFAANLNEDVLAFTLREVGPQRLLYGSDLPVTLMRGVREYDGDKYINYTDGDYSWNVNRKPPEIEAEYTFYLYQQLLAFKRAAERIGLSSADVADVMCGNAERLVAGVTTAS
jgi:hypothetical protein